MTTATRITNNVDCTACEATATERTCCTCLVSARITDCGHQAQPRPIAAGRANGADMSRDYCVGCAHALETLGGLLELMREATPGLQWDDLPTYGGEEPSDTQRVWSWDADSLIVGTCADDVRIVARDDENDEDETLSAEENDLGWSVNDTSGAKWWPDDATSEEIAASPDPAGCAVRICADQPQRGSWVS